MREVESPAGTLEIRVRAELPEDAEFSFQLYASARAYEMVRVPWSDSQKDAFLRSQFHLQYTHYHKFYPGAAYLIVVAGGLDIGRIYVDRTESEVRLMEITLLPEWRGRGIGGGLVRALLAEAEGTGKCVTLHVEMDNRAQHLYTRLGFQPVGEEGVYIRMEWKAVEVQPQN